MNGITIIDKPEGFTSFDVVAKLRGILKERRIGHGGTLDPMATGVLPIFVGGATKCVDLLPDNTKRYIARVRCGEKTDTGDVTGDVIEKSDAFFTEEQLIETLARFEGTQLQTPPMYSAIKVGGVRLYDLARQGKTVERKPREITVGKIQLLGFDEEKHEFEIDVPCTKGTYIRTLAEDIVASLGACACLSALRRTMSAGFGLKGALTLEDIQQAVDEGREDFLGSPEKGFLLWSAAELDDDLARLFLNGFDFDCSRARGALCEGDGARVYHNGRCIGVARVSEGKLHKLCAF